MENRKCQNKKCQKILPEGYKHRYCENCRNEHANTGKQILKGMAGIAVFVGGTALSIVTKGKFDIKK